MGFDIFFNLLKRFLPFSNRAQPRATTELSPSEREFNSASIGTGHVFALDCAHREMTILSFNPEVSGSNLGRTIFFSSLNWKFVCLRSHILYVIEVADFKNNNRISLNPRFIGVFNPFFSFLAKPKVPMLAHASKLITSDREFNSASFGIGLVMSSRELKKL